MPTPPARQYSFTDWQVNNPNAPPPGDRLDSEFDQTNTSVGEVITWANTSLNTDGSLRDGIVGQNNLVPGLFDDVSNDIIADVQPLVDQTLAASGEALVSAENAANAQTVATAAATQSMGASQAAVRSASAADASASAAEQSANDAGAWSTEAENAANSATGSMGEASAYAVVSQAWAEHMPDTIPPNILAVMGITGDHWSARWWANNAAQIVGGPYVPLDGSRKMTGALELYGPPTQPDQAATKGYIDELISAITSQAGMYFLGNWQVAANRPDLTGGPITGGDFYLAQTSDPMVPETAPAGIPGIGGQVIENYSRILWDPGGNTWVSVPPGRPYAVMDQRYLQLNGAVPMTAAIRFGSQTASAPNDLSRHINLYAGTFGFSVTAARFNMVAAAGSNISLTVGAVDSMYVSDTQIRLRVPAVAQAPAAADNSNTIATTAWVRSYASGAYLSLGGGILTGPLTLAGDPANANDAANKNYVDTEIAAAVAAVGGAYLPLVGGTLSGGLHFGSSAASGNADVSRHIDLYGGTFGLNVTSARLNYVIPAGSSHYFTTGDGSDILQLAKGLIRPLAGISFGDGLAANPTDLTKHIDLFGGGWGMNISSGRVNIVANNTAVLSFTGAAINAAVPVALPADPTTALQAATKQYVDAGDTAAVAVASHNAGRNLLNNAQFNIRQRGGGPFTAGGYCLDQWQLSLNLDTVNLTAATIPPGGMPLDEEALTCAQVTVIGNGSAGAYTAFVQQIEKMARLANKKVILSFYAAAGANGLKLGASIDQQFGTGGSPSAVVQGAGQSVTLSTNWTRYSLVFNLQSIVGKTLGTNGNSATSLIFWMSSGTDNAPRTGNIGVQSGTFYLWGMQLEIAEVSQTQPTPFEKLRPSDDLEKCQWYYRYIANAIIYFTATGATQSQVNTISYGGFMRGRPTISFAPNYTNCNGIQVNGGSGNQLDHANVQVASVAAGSAFVFFDMSVSAEL